jgi:hypothetical protein
MASAWITHVKKYAKDNNIKFGEALKKAAPSFKSISSSEPTRKMKKSRGKRSKKGGKSLRKR